MGLQPGFNLWIKKEGQVVLSLWRVRLLQAVERTGSISAAAAEMEVPYRRAWERLRESEERLGLTLVEGQVGGAGGGGAILTEAGREYVARFERFSEGLDALIEERFAAAFGDLR